MNLNEKIIYDDGFFRTTYDSIDSRTNSSFMLLKVWLYATDYEKLDKTYSRLNKDLKSFSSLNINNDFFYSNKTIIDVDYKKNQIKKDKPHFLKLEITLYSKNDASYSDIRREVISFNEKIINKIKELDYVKVKL